MDRTEALNDSSQIPFFISPQTITTILNLVPLSYMFTYFLLHKYESIKNTVTLFLMLIFVNLILYRLKT
jgi:hypothetical protein